VQVPQRRVGCELLTKRRRSRDVPRCCCRPSWTNQPIRRSLPTTSPPYKTSSTSTTLADMDDADRAILSRVINLEQRPGPPPGAARISDVQPLRFDLDDTIDRVDKIATDCAMTLSTRERISTAETTSPAGRTVGTRGSGVSAQLTSDLCRRRSRRGRRRHRSAW
jgi:hypothetical protein